MNITVISDIHLAHFTNYSFNDGFRDDQFRRLSKRIIEIAKEYNSEDLLIAGDLIDKPLLNSDEQHLLAEFIDTLGSHFRSIRYILGQHDLSHRNNDTIKYTDSTVNLYDKFNKMEYCDKKQFLLGGKTFYMRNYYPGVVQKCPEGTDIFVGHVTLMPGSYGQEFEDASTFSLGVFGDIHMPVDIAHCHSIGSPLQKSLSDYPYGTIGIIDTDNLKFTRVQVINEKNKFLRIYREGTEVNPDEYTWIIKKYDKVSTVKIKDGTSELEVSLSDINDVIETKVSESGLSEIHEKFKYMVPTVDSIDLNYNIDRLQVKNFLSIQELDIDFESIRGLKYVHGKNGSGKSSLLQALKVALIGSQRIKEYQKIQSNDKLELIIDLTYQNTKYRIYRAPGKTNFYINGELNNGSSKKDTDQVIFKYLPFLNYVELFNISYNNLFFNRFRTSKLLETMFGIQSLINYLNIVIAEIKSNNSQLKKLTQEKLLIEGRVDSIKEDGRLTLEKYNEVNIPIPDGIEDKLSEINSLPKLIESKKSALKTLESRSVVNPYKKCDNPEELISEGKELRDEIKSLETVSNLSGERKLLERNISMDGIECPNCKHKIHSEKYDSYVNRLKVIDNEIEKLTSSLKFKDKSIPELQSRIDELKQELTSNKNFESFNESIRGLSESIRDSKVEISELTGKLERILNGKSVEEVKTELYNYISLKTKIKELKSRLDELSDKKKSEEGKLVEITDKVTETTEYLDKLERYKELFSRESDNSIYKAVIQKIGEGLSDSNLTFIADEDQLILKYKVDNDWIEYDNCSSGEKALADLLLLQKLSKLIGKNGLLVLDEVAANLDVNKYDLFTQIVTEFEATDIFLIMHSELFQNYDHSINVSRENNNSTFIIER